MYFVTVENTDECLILTVSLYQGFNHELNENQIYCDEHIKKVLCKLLRYKGKLKL